MLFIQVLDCVMQLRMRTCCGAFDVAVRHDNLRAISYLVQRWLCPQKEIKSSLKLTEGHTAMSRAYCGIAGVSLPCALEW